MIDPPPPVPLGPPQELARLPCPHCGHVLRFESRSAAGAEQGWAYDCHHCRRELGVITVSAAGMTRLRLAAV